MAKNKAVTWENPPQKTMRPHILLALMELAQATDLPVKDVKIEDDGIHVSFYEDMGGAIEMRVDI